VKNKIVIVGGRHADNQNIIQRITGNTTVLCDVQEGFLKCKWIIDTKYYIAPVEIISLPEAFPPNLPSIDTSQLGSVCEALILLLVPGKNESFESIKEWKPFIEEHSPNILLCASVGPCSDVNKEMYVKWCIENGIEFVEIVDVDTNPTEEPTPTQEDDRYADREGVERIIEALTSTMWPTMVKKGGKPVKSSQELLPMLEQLADLSIDPTDNVEEEKDDFDTFGEFTSHTDDKKALSVNLQALSSFLNDIGNEEETEGDVGKVENFEQALMDLKRLRDKAQTMSDDERRAFALKVVSSLMSEEDMEDWNEQ